MRLADEIAKRILVEYRLQKSEQALRELAAAYLRLQLAHDELKRKNP